MKFNKKVGVDFERAVSDKAKNLRCRGQYLQANATANIGDPKPGGDPLSIEAARLTMLSVSYLSVSQEPMFHKFHKKSWRRPIFPGHIVQVSSA